MAQEAVRTAGFRYLNESDAAEYRELIAKEKAMNATLNRIIDEMLLIQQDVTERGKELWNRIEQYHQLDRRRIGYQVIDDGERCRIEEVPLPARRQSRGQAN
jgi:hypothetical protein